MGNGPCLLYIHKISALSRQFPAASLLGPRQVGKDNLSANVFSKPQRTIQGKRLGFEFKYTDAPL